MASPTAAGGRPQTRRPRALSPAALSLLTRCPAPHCAHPPDPPRGHPPHPLAYLHKRPPTRPVPCSSAQLVEAAEAKAYYGLASNYRALEALVNTLLTRDNLTGEEVRQVLEEAGEWPQLCPRRVLLSVAVCFVLRFSATNGRGEEVRQVMEAAGESHLALGANPAILF